MSQELPPSFTRTTRQRALVPVARVATAGAPSKSSWLARAVRWPLRKLLKGLYVTFVAVRGNRASSAVLALIVAGLLGSGLIVYRVTHPAGGVPTSAVGGTGPSSGSTPFTIIDAAAPPLPSAVIMWMHGHQTFNAGEVWNTFSVTEQQALTKQGVTESALQSDFDALNSQHTQITEFIYSGGYRLPDGSSHYTVEMLLARGSQSSIQTYYFLVDADGKIAASVNLTATG